MKTSPPKLLIRFLVLTPLVLGSLGCGQTTSDDAAEPTAKKSGTSPDPGADSSSDKKDAAGPAEESDGASATESKSVLPKKVSERGMRMAAFEGYVEVVRSALESGTDINSRDAQQQLTALHMAAYNGHTAVVRLLLENQAEIDPRDHEGKTPLLHACTGPYQETVQLLLESGADINAKESTEGFTPLMMAAGLGEIEVVSVLLRHDADREIRDADSDQAIDHARKSGHAAIVKLLES